MDERVRFISRLLDGEKMARLCAEFGISRKTSYKIYRRYKGCGVEGLTDRSRRDTGERARQAFYAGVRKPRELAHDVQVYRAYERAAKAIVERGGRIRRVVLHYELNREYQRFLQERNRRPDADGRPDRDEHEVQDWALTHHLPYFDEQVHFPDVRIEWEDEYRRAREEDIEVTPDHYRGVHAAAAARSGFSRYHAGSVAAFGDGGRSRGGRGGRAPSLAEEMLS